MPDGCAALPKAHTHHTSTTAIRRRTGRVARPHVVDPRIPRSHSRSISGHTSAPTHTDCSHPQPHTHNSKNAHPRAHASPCRVHFTRQPSGCLARAARIVVASCDRQPSVGGGLRGAQVLQARAHASPCRVHITRQPSGCSARAARIVVASCDSHLWAAAFGAPRSSRHLRSFLKTVTFVSPRSAPLDSPRMSLCGGYVPCIRAAFRRSCLMANAHGRKGRWA